MNKILLALTLGLALMACPTSPKCPIHTSSNGVYDHDEWPDGKHVKYFKCNFSGHLFGIVC